MDSSRLTQYQQFCYELDEVIYRNQTIDDILLWVLERLPQLLQLDRVLSFSLKYPSSILSASGQKFKTAQAQLNYPTSEHFTFAVEKSALCTRALKDSPHSTLIQGSTLPESSGEHSIFAWSDFTSSLIYPLTRISNEQCIILGFLVLQTNAKLEPWPPEQLMFLRSLNSRLSTGLFHSQALGQIQSLVNEQTKQLEWSLGVQKKLAEKMRQQIEQLQRANQLKDEFMSTISHELNTPLTTMKMAIQMLKRIVKEGDDPRYDRYLYILEEEWNREFTLIKNLLTLQQLETGDPRLRPQSINLITLMDVVAQEFTQKWQPLKNLKVKIDYDLSLVDSTSLTLATDGDSLKSVLEELLLNAGKFSAPDQQVLITLARSTDGSQPLIHLSITNIGLGFAEAEQQLIFDKFYRGQGVTDRAIPGTGLGLALVKILVELLQGSIDGTSHSDPHQPQLAQTTFHLILPNLT